MSLIPDQPQTIGSMGAVASTKRLLHEISALSKKFDDCLDLESQEKWFEETSNVFDWCLGMEDGSLMGQAAMLVTLESRWPDLPLKIREKFNNNFHYFAETRTGKQWTTIENHMRAIRTFFIDQIAPSDPIPVPTRDASGAIITDTAKQPIFKYVRWDPVSVSISKLVAISARARAGQMTQRLWSVAADPRATHEQMVLALSERSGGNGGGGSGGGRPGARGKRRLPVFLGRRFFVCKRGHCRGFCGEFESAKRRR